MRMIFALPAALFIVRATTALATITVEVYTSRGAFESRLGGSVQVVDFDDITTSGSTPVSFAADRYEAAHGIVITGQGGQYVSRDFTFPGDFDPSSAPNAYAPGPMNSGVDPGGFTTDVTFGMGATSGTVAGFGCVFIDADFPGIGPSGLTIYDTSNGEIGNEGPVSGGNGSQLFRGLVTVDDMTSQPVAAIARVHVVSGNEWPSRDVDEGVVLDDFVFGSVDLNGGTTTTTLPPGGCDATPTFTSITCRLGELADKVNAATDLGRLASGLRNAVQKARDKVAKAQSEAAAQRAKQTKTQLKKAAKALRSFLAKTRSRSARKLIPQATRDMLQAIADPIGKDVATLARTF